MAENKCYFCVIFHHFLLFLCYSCILCVLFFKLCSCYFIFVCLMWTYCCCRGNVRTFFSLPAYHVIIFFAPDLFHKHHDNNTVFLPFSLRYRCSFWSSILQMPSPKFCRIFASLAFSSGSGYLFKELMACNTTHQLKCIFHWIALYFLIVSIF